MASYLGKKFEEAVWFFISLIPLKKCIINCLHVIFLMDPWWNVIPEFILHFISTQIICIDVWGNHLLWWIALQRKVPIDITVSVSWQIHHMSLICWSCYNIILPWISRCWYLGDKWFWFCIFYAFFSSNM